MLGHYGLVQNLLIKMEMLSLIEQFIEGLYSVSIQLELLGVMSFFVVT